MKWSGPLCPALFRLLSRLWPFQKAEKGLLALVWNGSEMVSCLDLWFSACNSATASALDHRTWCTNIYCTLEKPKKKVSRAEQWKTPGLVDYCILHLYFTCIRPCPCQQLRRSSSQAQLAMLINIEFSLENFLTSWHHVDTCWDLSLDIFSM